MKVKQNVEDAIRSNHILVYSKSYCPYSIKAKQLLESLPNKISPPKIYELDLMGEEGVEIQSYLTELTKQRTVPNIFIGHKHVGGSDDLANLHNAGVLQSMVMTKITGGSNSHLLLILMVAIIAGIGFVGLKFIRRRGSGVEKEKM